MLNAVFFGRNRLRRFCNLIGRLSSMTTKTNLSQIIPLLIPEKFKSKVRNIGISAHIDSGKTTLSERILFYTGKIRSIHDVRGSFGVGAKMDHMELEREKGITIQSAATFCQWHDFSINLIDTPGHVDFTIEVERALRVLDGAVLVLCAVAGVQPQTLTVDRQMRRYNIPRLVFVNKMDRVGANPAKAVRELKEILRLNAALIQIPIGIEGEFEGVVDVINRVAIRFSGSHGEDVTVDNDVPSNLIDEMESVRSDLVSTLANVDPVIEELFLNETDPSALDIELAIRRSVLAHKFTPVLMGSAYKNRAVQPLLDAICKYLPCPTDITSTAFEIEDEALYQQARQGTLSDSSVGSKLHGGSRSDVKASAGSTAQQVFRQSQAAARVAAITPEAEKGKNAAEIAKERMNQVLKPIEIFCEPNKPTIALAFKLDDSKFGQLTYVRIYQGKVTKGMNLYNCTAAKRMKVPRLVRMHADEMQDIQEATAGDVICLFGLDGICSMDTLTDGSIKTVMNPMFIPEPVISISIKPKLTTSQTAFGKAINKFTREDPTLRIAQDEKTKQLLLSGMGELHLEIYVERLKREFGIECDVGTPSVNYKETIRKRTNFDYLHKKQTGGSGQYGRVIGFIEPMSDALMQENDGADFKFDNHVIGLNIPPEFIPSIEKGVLDVVNEGAISGHQITRVRFVVNDGVSHPVDSTDLAFRTAGSQAMRQAVRNADPVILEPLMTVDVTVPSEYQSTVVGGLNKRQGTIIGTETSSDGVSSIVKAEVPLSQMIGYATDLRSVTKGKGEFSLEYCRHAPVIFSVQETLVKKFQEQLYAKPVEEL